MAHFHLSSHQFFKFRQKVNYLSAWQHGFRKSNIDIRAQMSLMGGWRQSHGVIRGGEWMILYVCSYGSGTLRDFPARRRRWGWHQPSNKTPSSLIPAPCALLPAYTTIWTPNVWKLQVLGHYLRICGLWSASNSFVSKILAGGESLKTRM